MEQALFEFTFSGRSVERQEVENIGVFEGLLRQVGLWGRKRSGEIIYCSALPLVKTRFDLQRQDISGPAVSQRGAGVPEACRWIFNFLQQQDIVSPGKGEHCSGRLLR